METINNAVASIEGVNKYDSKEYILYETPFTEIKTLIEICPIKAAEAERLRKLKTSSDTDDNIKALTDGEEFKELDKLEEFEEPRGA